MVWDLKKKLECFHMALCIFEVERIPPWLREPTQLWRRRRCLSKSKKKKKKVRKGLFLRFPGMKLYTPLHFK